MDRYSYDEAYKYIFSSKRIACQLLHSFVNVPFVREITPENLQLVDKSFISDELLKREADLIYKVSHRGKSAYIYILMEFQSTPDKAIPVRMLNYITMFYDLLLRNSKTGKLPPVLPLLIYNGSKDWTVPLRLEELIEPLIPERYIPRFEYYPIIEKDYSDETLFEINNLVSAIMILENSRDDENLQDIINRVAKCLKKEHKEDLRLFKNWFLKMFSDERPEVKVDDIPKWGDGGHMFAETAQKLTRKWLEQGIEQGIEQGELNDKHEVLIRQLELKFGLTGDEKDIIMAETSSEALNAALDAVIMNEEKQSILELLN